MKTFILIFFFISFQLTGKYETQNQNIADSLQSVISSGKHDTLKIKVMNRLFLLFEFNDTVKVT